MTDQLCREVRHGRICREDALRVNRYYQNASNNKGTVFTDWLKIPHESYKYILDSFKSIYSTEHEPTSLEDQQCAEFFSNSFITNHYQGENVMFILWERYVMLDKKVVCLHVPRIHG